MEKEENTKKEEAAVKRPFMDFGTMHAGKRTVNKSQPSFPSIYGEAQGSSFDRYSNKQLVDIVKGRNLPRKRRLSEYINQTSGIYSRAVRYLSDIYRFDFMMYPNLDLNINITEDSTKATLDKFNDLLEFFDASSIQLMSRRWAHKVCLVGAYYGYISEDVDDKLVVQDLPIDFCRSRFSRIGKPAVEFNLKYFDVAAQSEKFRQTLLGLFPKEIRAAYKRYKNGTLINDEDPRSKDVWFLLDLNRAFKFNFNDSDDPPFLYALPSLLQLEEVQDLTKEKLLQAIQKILVQKLDINAQGILDFTMKEVQQLNQNAANMLGDTVGVSVLTTVAEVSVHDLDNSDGTSAQDQVRAAENSVYNDLGISTSLFNSTGNLSLQRSIVTDEAFVKQLLLQFEQFFNDFISWRFNDKEHKFRMKMLHTTIFNYQDTSNAYKDLTKIGFSRFLPMIALGHTQKEVTSMVKLEQQMLQLDNWMLPPFSSNTMSSGTWIDIKAIQKEGELKKQASNSEEAPIATTPEQQAAETAAKIAEDIGTKTSGRPELSDDEKSDKTLANESAK